MISSEEQKRLEKVVAKTGVLDLSFRGLSEAPAFVWKLSSLRVLRLDHNEIEVIALPKAAVCLPNVQRIDLSSNRIREISANLAEVCGDDFQMLDLSHNQLRELPSGFQVFFSWMGYDRTTKRLAFRGNSELEKLFRFNLDMADEDDDFKAMDLCDLLWSSEEDEDSPPLRPGTMACKSKDKYLAQKEVRKLHEQEINRERQDKRSQREIL